MYPQDIKAVPLPEAEGIGGFDDFRNISALQVGTGARSFKADQDGIFLGGNTFATAPFRVNMAGAVVASSLTLTNAVIIDPTITGIQTGSEIAIQGWQHDLVFSVTDLDTVAWASGTITLMNGDTYSIDAGNTGNMAASTYIYLDIATSVTVLQTTTTAATAVGSGKILITTAKNSTNEALFQVFGGIGGIKLAGGDIENLTIAAGQLASNAVEEAKVAADAITATKIAVSGLDGATGDVAANHIIAGMIQTNAITSVKIQADAVTATKINVVGLDGATGRIIVADQTDADVVTGGINSHAVTLINAGKILISGATALSAWSHASDATLIDGGDIYTNSVTATQIAATTITASEIAANTITANEIAANTVTASQIAAATITATEISGTQLDVVATNTGTLDVDEHMTLGADANVKIDGVNKRILINDGSDDRILIGYQSGGF